MYIKDGVSFTTDLRLVVLLQSAQFSSADLPCSPQSLSELSTPSLTLRTLSEESRKMVFWLKTGSAGFQSSDI